MKRKLFILAEPRSGSSWMMNTLNSHKKVDLRTELYNHAAFPEVIEFHKSAREHFPRCIDYLENKLAAPPPGPALRKNIQYTGCKILLNQLHLISAEFPAYFIDSYNDAYFIFLCRENIVAAQISLKIAHTYKTWHIQERNDIIKRTVNIPPGEFYKKLERTRQQRDYFLELLKGFAVKHLRLTYEKLFAHKKKTMADICDFLEIPNRSFRFSAEKKGNPFRAEEILENFDEVKRFFEQYPDYEEMLLRGGVEE
jgi:LPS sulfotransferase NodH